MKMHSFPGGPDKSVDTGGSSSSVSWATPSQLSLRFLPKVHHVISSFQLGGFVVVEMFALGPSPEEDPTTEDDMETFMVGVEVHIV